MGWDVRGDRRYYCRFRKVGGKVVKEYVGWGAIGELGAAVDALERFERAAQKRDWRDFCATLEASDVPLEQFCELTDCLLRAALLAAGYHQHDRGAWRRRYERKSKKPSR